jgi:prolyl-tRNA editing enzyme YbaK/EbsC (Cys-tRNA(Pro) deacylase)
MSIDVVTGEIAKTVVFSTPKGHVRAVVPADARVWRTKLEELLDEDVWLTAQDELREAYPDFEPGAIPPFGGPDDVVIVDTAVAERPTVIIEVARRELAVRLPGSALVEVSRARVSDIQEPRGS